MKLPAQLKADITLFFVTLSWGGSYLMTDYCLTAMGPLTLNAMRFLIASLLAAALCWKKMRGVTRETRRSALLLGALLAVVYCCSTMGLLYTSMSNAAFLCALAVVLTPIANFLIFRIRPNRRLLLVLVLCLGGVALMTLGDSLRPRLGDVLCFLCAAFYAIDLIFAERAVKRPRVDAFQLGVLHLGVAGAVSLLFAFIFEQPALPQGGKMWGAVLFLAIVCTGVAFIAQTIAQQYTTSTHVGVIFALEPVFAGVVAFFVAGELLTVRGYIGAALLLAGTFIMELPLGRRQQQEQEGQDEHSDLRQE